MAYIYCITNDINDKVYIGKTVYSIDHRFKEHIRDAYNHKCNSKLHRAILKYGKEHFQIKEIEKCLDSNCGEREQYYIQLYDSVNNGYNISYGGEGESQVDLKQLKDLVKIFLKYNFLYQAMKTILLICLYYFYYQKLQIEDIDNSKKNFLLYFNFAYFLKMKEYDKCKYYIENKSKYYSLEKNLDGEKQNFDKFKEDLKTIFEEYKVAWNINDNDKETKFWNNSSN